MKTFKIEVRETLSRIIEIEANSIDDALAKAEELYKKEEIVLNAEDSTNTDFLEFED